MKISQKNAGFIPKKMLVLKPELYFICTDLGK